MKQMLKAIRTIAFLFVILPPMRLSAESPRVSTAAANQPIWLAVARAELAPALEPLAERRRQDGFEAIVSTKPIAASLAALSRRPQFLLLVGDDEAGKEDASWYLPAQRKPFYRSRAAQAREFASDMAWGDLDRTGVPVVPVGRIPARSREQAAPVVKKIIDFEAQPPGLTDLQMPVWLGSPEYTDAINAVASSLGMQMVQSKGPTWLRPWFVSGNPHDPFCGWPPDQPKLFSRQMRMGGILGVLMGHANEDGFFSMQFQQQTIWYRADRDAGGFAHGPPVPPLVFFSCATGNFTRAEPCQAKNLLFSPSGPVAVVAATAESHPMTNYFSGLCLLKALGGNERRLGPLWLRAQNDARRSRDFVMEAMLRDVEGKLDSQIDDSKLRRDQILIYAILGDPATRLRLPGALQASVQPTKTGWHWKAEKPPEAARLDVGYRKEPAFEMLPTAAPTQAEKAQKAFDAANVSFEYSTVASLAKDVPWEGTIDRGGILRLVASGGGRQYVAVLKLAGKRR